LFNLNKIILFQNTIIELKKILILRKNIDFKLEKIIIRGIIFWKVHKKNKIHIFTDFNNEINHIWKGAAPNFINIANILKKKKKLLEKKILSKVANKNNAEDKLWIKKYFIVFSNILFPLNDIRGKNLNIFISREIQSISLDLLLRAKKN